MEIAMVAAAAAFLAMMRERECSSLLKRHSYLFSKEGISAAESAVSSCSSPASAFACFFVPLAGLAWLFAGLSVLGAEIPGPKAAAPLIADMIALLIVCGLAAAAGEVASARASRRLVLEAEKLGSGGEASPSASLACLRFMPMIGPLAMERENVISAGDGGSWSFVRDRRGRRYAAFTFSLDGGEGQAWIIAPVKKARPSDIVLGQRASPADALASSSGAMYIAGFLSSGGIVFRKRRAAGTLRDMREAGSKA